MFRLMRLAVYLDRQMNPQTLRVGQHDIHALAIDLIGKWNLGGGALVLIMFLG